MSATPTPTPVAVPLGATTFVGQAAVLSPGEFRGARLRHTFRPHGARDWLLIYTHGGSGLHRFPGGEYCTCARDITLYRPDVFQDYQIAPGTGTEAKCGGSPKHWDILYAHFLPKDDWLPWMQWPELSPGFMLLSIPEPAVARRVAALLREAIRQCAGTGPRRQAFAQNAMERMFLQCDAVNPRQSAAQPEPRVRRAADHLAAHLAHPFDEDAVARAAGLSASRLRHLFRLEMGDSPRSYQEKLRIRRAQDLLAMSRQTIGEIAHELGFENPFYFTLRFKKHVGESPRAYRQRVIRMG